MGELYGYARVSTVGQDLAIQEAMRIGLGLKSRPTVKQMQPLAEPWRPLRGAAAHLWWAYYHAVKKRDGILPNQPAAVSNAKRGSNKKPVAKRSPPKRKMVRRKIAPKKAGGRK